MDANEYLDPPSTTGQKLLRDRGLSSGQIAVMIGGCTKMAVHHWLHGSVRPSRAFRARMLDIFQIDPESWDRPVTAAPASNVLSLIWSKEPTSAALIAATPNIDGVNQRIAESEKMLSTEDLPAFEKKLWFDANLAARKQRAQLERDALDVQKLVITTHPLWKELDDAILDALEPFPEAFEAYCLVCERYAGR